MQPLILSLRALRENHVIATPFRRRGWSAAIRSRSSGKPIRAPNGLLVMIPGLVLLLRSICIALNESTHFGVDDEQQLVPIIADVDEIFLLRLLGKYDFEVNHTPGNELPFH